MPKLPSAKRVLIDKANSNMVIFIAIASFVVVFSLVASRALLSQKAYQTRVTRGKQKAVQQLKDNIAAVSDLQKAYQAFVNTPENVLGGNPKGSGDKDGDNAKLILDALPSKYDFPALTASVEKLLTSQNYNIESIQGADQEVQQEGNQSSPNPTPVAMPFEVSFGGTYTSMGYLLDIIERSIRPIQIQSMDLSGTDNDLHVTIDAQTYYQPAKSLSITSEVIK